MVNVLMDKVSHRYKSTSGVTPQGSFPARAEWVSCDSCVQTPRLSRRDVNTHWMWASLVLAGKGMVCGVRAPRQMTLTLRWVLSGQTRGKQWLASRAGVAIVSW